MQYALPRRGPAPDYDLPVSFGRYRLRELQASDTEQLYRWACDPTEGYRWRFGGATPAPEVFQGLLWNGVLCQYLAESRQEIVPL